MINESSRFYRWNGTIGWCALTGEGCSNDPAKHDCRSCLVPIYMWLHENKVKE